jgi:asparagine synthase (glutamine-hydrolysing)
MCGIAGGFRHNIPEGQSLQVLRRLRHRGPDDNGFWQREGVWLASTRLAIQDLSPAGHQPMFSNDKNYCIVYNGELYNAPELREKLRTIGNRFHTHCDTEVLLNAFITWGSDCLDKLEGDFAFAIWNEAKEELFLARDPMGVKPIYIYNDGDKLLFASEIKVLPGLEGLDYRLRPEVFRDYLTYLYSPSDKTPFLHINKLLPGHFLKLHLRKEIGKQQQYFKIKMGGKQTVQSKDWRRSLEDTLSDVVEGQLYSDVPVGVMLSGGLDSSLIAALAKKAAPDMQLQAFCIDAKGMDTEGFDEDVKYARQMATHLGIPLQEISGGIMPSAKWIDEFVWQMDEPQADPAGWYTGLIAAAAQRTGVKVLLSGTGGDDVFSGYRRHCAIKSFSVTSMLPKAAAAAAETFQRMMPGESANLRRLGKLLSGSGLSPLRAAIHSHFWTSRDTIRMLMAPDHMSPIDPYQLFEKLLEEIPEEKDLLQQMLFLEQRTFLPHHNLAYMDKMSMAHSVEVRVPFVDRQVIELAAAMPASQKLKGKTTKAILRRVAKPYVPESIINRSKTGFGAPLRQWMRGPLRSIVRERLLDDSFQRRGFFNRSVIETLITDNEKSKKDNAYTLFSLLCIESWLRQFAPSA